MDSIFFFNCLYTISIMNSSFLWARPVLIRVHHNADHHCTIFHCSTANSDSNRGPDDGIGGARWMELVYWLCVGIVHHEDTSPGTTNWHSGYLGQTAHSEILPHTYRSLGGQHTNRGFGFVGIGAFQTFYSMPVASRCRCLYTDVYIEYIVRQQQLCNCISNTRMLDQKYRLQSDQGTSDPKSFAYVFFCGLFIVCKA